MSRFIDINLLLTDKGYRYVVRTLHSPNAHFVFVTIVSQTLWLSASRPACARRRSPSRTECVGSMIHYIAVRLTRCVGCHLLVFHDTMLQYPLINFILLKEDELVGGFVHG